MRNTQHLSRVFSTTKSILGSPRNYRVLFFGSDQFTVEILSKLSSVPSLVSHVELVHPCMGKNLAREFALTQNWTCHRLPPNLDFRMKTWERPQGDFDIGLVASFGHFLPRSLIESFPLGMLNVHPSLLPRYRGASPIQHTLFNGDEETGVSIIKVDPNGLDIGDVVAQKAIQVPMGATFESMVAKLGQLGGELLVQTLLNFDSLISNSQPGATGSSGSRILEHGQKRLILDPCKASKITSEQCIARWKAMTAEEIYRKWQGLYGFDKFVTSINGQRVVLVDLVHPHQLSLDCQKDKKMSEAPPVLDPGSFFYSKRTRCIHVICKDHAEVLVKSLILQGRKIMSATDFWSGYLHKLNARSFDS